MYNEDIVRANDDYRREQLTRSWTHHGDSSLRQLLHLPSAFRARRAA